jgi:hypothetical protein
MTTSQRTIMEFMTHATTNLHAGTHTSSCFKKDNECRNKLPQPKCEQTKVHFNNENALSWWSWMGEKNDRIPFLTETKRHCLDVFMNNYHPDLSLALGSNTNVQCGMDGAHVIYVTMYASKSTVKEDNYAAAQIARAVYQHIRHDQQSNENMTNIGIPFQNGYRAMLATVLSHTDAVVVSAPMAWFLMRNQSRFLFSHDYAYAPFDLLLKRSVPSRIINVNQNTYFANRVDNYLYRPRALEHINWYDFVAEYDVVHLSAKNQNDVMRFSSEEHSLFHIRGVKRRKNMATPIVCYYDFPCASTFGGNIFSETFVSNVASEKFSYAALCLFVPFRNKKSFETLRGTCFTKKLQHAMLTNALSGQSIKRLQNVQNCHNMMKAGRQKDVLERITEPLLEPSRTKKRQR